MTQTRVLRLHTQNLPIDPSEFGLYVHRQDILDMAEQVFARDSDWPPDSREPMDDVNRVTSQRKNHLTIIQFDAEQNFDGILEILFT